MRKRLGATALLAASAVGVLVVGQLLASKGLAWGGEFGSIGCFFLTLAAFVWSLLVPLFPVVDPFPPKEIDDAREDLARILRRQWEHEERLRGMNDPGALPVRWKVMSRAEVAMLPGQGQAPGGGSTSRPGLIGDFHEIRSKAYDQAPQGRLVILGSAGAGKSMLVIRLALELLGTRKPGDLVPVIVPAAACDPKKGLSAWVADQLVRYLPGLDAKVKTAATKKSRKADVLADQVLPILDGLDELPDYSRAKVIDEINSVGTARPIVVTSRLDEYRHSATSAQGRAVAQAMHIEVLPLETQVVQDYLGEADGRWIRVFDLLRRQENAGPLEAALQSPLMVWLARTIYRRGDRNPDELANWQSFPDQETIELHLLDELLPAVYEPQEPVADARDEKAPRYRCTPQQARRWLAFLAAELDRDRRLDLEWWELDRTVRYWRPGAFALRAALVWGTVLGLAGWLLQRQRGWRYAAHSLPADLDRLLLAGPAGRRIVPAVDYLVNLFAGAAPGWVRPRSSVDAILARAPWHPLPSLPVLLAWIALLATGAGLVSAAFDGIRLGMKPATLRTGAPDMLRVTSAVGLWAIFLLAVLVLALTLAKRPITAGMSAFFHMPAARLLLALCMLWMLAHALTPVPEPLGLKESASPGGVLRLDRRASTLPLVVRRCCGLVLAWLCFGPAVAAAYGLYAVVRLLCTVLLGSVHTASGRFSDTRVWLACRHRMPARPMTFLADAHRRGVLRQTGAAYQFRHLRLQRRLAVQHPRWSLWATLPAAAGSQLLLSHAARDERIWAADFEQAAGEPAAEVGEPASEVRRVGPGSAQRFHGRPGQRPWVACVLPGREPVLVAWPVWEAIRQAGGGTAEDALAAVGYPVACVPPGPGGPRIVRANAERVEMAGGDWGPGLLVRDEARRRWRWEPAESYYPPTPWENPQEHRPPTHQSRIRVTATIPWASAGVAIAPEAREELLTHLSSSDLDAVLRAVSERRGADPAATAWEPADNWEELHRRDYCCGYVCAACRTDGIVVAEAEVRLSLHYQVPSAITVATSTELRITDESPWHAAVPAGPAARGAGVDDPRMPMTLDELLRFLTVACRTVTEVLPSAVVKDPVSERLAGCPLVQWELWAARQDDPVSSLSLLDIVDFGPLLDNRPTRSLAGPGGPRQAAPVRAPVAGLPQPGTVSITMDPPRPGLMQITMTGPLELSQDDRSRQARRALARMLERHGFGDIPEDWPAGPRQPGSPGSSPPSSRP